MMKSRNKQRGQAMVESALVMLIFVPVLMGIADFGQFIYFHASLTERARAASRYGAVHTYTDATAIQNVAVYNDPSPAAGTAPLIPFLTTGLVTATLDDFGTDSARITVTITNYPFNFISGFMSRSTWYRTVIATEPYEIVN
jgi:Flp pilus assembly protein TadG